MKLEQKQKQLEMALTEHKALKINLDDNQELILKWDNEISNYRGYSKKLDIEIGIWDLTYLLQIANGRFKEYSLEIAYE